MLPEREGKVAGDNLASKSGSTPLRALSHAWVTVPCSFPGRSVELCSPDIC